MLKDEYISCLHIKTQLKSQKKKIILLIISNGDEWHYLAIKKLSALLKEIT